MNFIKKCSLLATFLVLTSVVFGCETMPTQTMVDVDLVGDRTVKYLLLDPGQTSEQAAVEMITGIEDEQVYHFAVRICDIGTDNSEVSCKDTIVLERVGMNPDPEDTSAISADREVSSIFWYDQSTLYISYLERPSTDGAQALGLAVRHPQPKMQKCLIGEDNMLFCNEQEHIAEMLQWTTTH